MLLLTLFVKGVSGRCSVNLINDGVVVNRNSGDVTVSFRVTEQGGVDPSQVTFTCTVTGPVPVPIPFCKFVGSAL